jgi:murein DD-endopeptidase MepM/ murein hydrolase activator NlpD
MGFVRGIALVAASALVWMAGASQVQSQVRLPVLGVVVGGTITQQFGCTSLELEPFAGWCPTLHFHSGIDLAAPEGTDVYSATSGTVLVGDDPAGAGKYVVVRVDRNVRILYCHLSTFRVRAGDQVTPGQVIGTVGSTGLATGPHVHFEIQVGGHPVDPAAWLAS